MTWKEMVVWIFCLLMLAVFLTSPVTCTMHRHRLIAKAIEGGADPIEAKCAIESDILESAVCVTAARTRHVR